ncbi:MAG TPA: SemiSWEET transporter [Kofleriaceae bacterium]|nr:SemiSWEET transporter [Kofleriaceae bacterium]
MTAVVVGVMAAVLSVTSFVPQAWKIWKTRETEALSKKMCIFNTTAFALWTVYGVLEQQWPIIAPNAICFVLAGFILVMKLKSR